MGKSKYYYKGLTLVKYCEENGIDYNTVIARINYIKYRKKYRDYSNEQIIEEAMKIEPKTKYTYKGMKLTDYCKKNKLNVNSVTSTISFLRKSEKYKNYSNEQIVDVVINKLYKKQKAIKYMYEGVSLHTYCMSNGISYAKIRLRITLMEKNSEYKNLSKDELIKLAIEMDSIIEHHMYKGVSLMQYCRKNNLNYNTIVVRARRLKKDARYSECTDEQLIDLAINKRNGKYFLEYNGELLVDYCRENNLDYEKLKNKINYLKKDEQYSKLSRHEVIELAIDSLREGRNKNVDNSKRRYDGIPLSVYCANNGLNLANVRAGIFNARHNDKYKDYSSEEIIKMVIEKESVRALKRLKAKLKEENMKVYLLNLDDLERNFILLLTENTYKDVAKKFNVSVEKIVEKERSILEKLNKQINKKTRKY